MTGMVIPRDVLQMGKGQNDRQLKQCFLSELCGINITTYVYAYWNAQRLS